ncbi:MAG: NB-ARC domain-containing protein [Aliidongia sp.]
MVDPVTLTGILFGAICAIPGGVLANRADSVVCHFGKGFIAGLTEVGIPRNHDALRAMRRAELNALGSLGRELREGKAVVTAADMYDCDAFLPRLDEFLQREEAAAESLVLTDDLAKALTSSMDATLARSSFSTGEDRLKSLKAHVISVVWKEIGSLDPPNAFRKLFDGDEPGVPSWFQAYGVFLGQALKRDTNFRAIFTADRLANILNEVIDFRNVVDIFIANSDRNYESMFTRFDSLASAIERIENIVLDQRNLTSELPSDPIRPQNRDNKKENHRNSRFFKTVGRDQIVTDIWRWFKEKNTHGQTDLSIAVYGLPGIGKSTITDLVVEDYRLRNLFPDGVLVARLGKDAGNSTAIGIFKVWARRENLNIPDEDTASFKIDDWMERVREELRNRQFLLVIDDVWDTKVGRLLKLGGERCGYLITTRKPVIANDLACHSFPVPSLTEVESIQLLKNIAPNVFFDDEAGEKIQKHIAMIAKSVGGLPLALVLIGSLLKKIGTRQDRRMRIRHSLNFLGDVKSRLNTPIPDLENPGDDNGDLTLTAAIGASYDALGETEGERASLQRALRRLSGLRPDPNSFSLALAKSVAKADEDTIWKLTDAGLIDVVSCDSVTDHDDDSIPEEEQDLYNIHRTITDYANLMSRECNPNELQTVHRDAAEYFSERVKEIEERSQSSALSFRRWFRFEDPTFQQAMDNWRYYLSSLGNYDEVAFVFTKAWFDAFWWWGCFEDFDFCNRMIAEWPQGISDVSQVAKDIADIQGFKEAYPKETEQRIIGQEGRWRTARTKLENIYTRYSLNSDPQLLDKNHHDLRGLLNIFLAEAYRFGERDYVAAEECYRDAVAQFDIRYEDDKERWNRAWTRYHLADCLREVGRLEEAEATCEEALPFGKRDEDFEILALLFHVLGDIAMAAERTDKAVQDYHQAVLYAYRYQVEPVSPDPYTVRFYPFMAMRVAGSILKLRKDLALDLASRLQKVWRDGEIDSDSIQHALDKEDRKILAWTLFARPCEVNDLSDDDAKTGYEKEVRRRLTQLEAASGGGI